MPRWMTVCLVFSVRSRLSGSDHFARCERQSRTQYSARLDVVFVDYARGAAVLSRTGAYSHSHVQMVGCSCTDGGMFWSTHLSRENLSLGYGECYVNARLKSPYVTVFQQPAWLAQSAERETLNLKVAGSTPASGFPFCSFSFFFSCASGCR